ncbi:uncharacterized protein YpmB [Clostridium acetobutylicum]|uniref:Uncharacterized protein n=1 Tax=Clostridium acetobutylicum (strain ATCC 824 / DSM 792 / JCM 1419 / IAM 19013 / LMG 5710 / NBRC 13948 / NRRL B-527 / VKM B-1787 / 2291 / W) TaxID=272562 RepID=Q97LZ5_CLOAB|nr:MULTISPECIES: hypothetical protein [Clostridium]AAK78385.1 Hypothetical protein CA_C0405 [Clostridium acetobutylicum ATCC 824]ADZ19454.1 Conserved hypothetical protein [Clostridium acetobutylicum EA 2018]AEI31222.1 hypothetical protein SMB_G0413 [Clostridium acetobutylicum DSM 1731]AWV80108.1 hypothetical protein DK921_08380 [Clostridium acetobutylicum]KHD37820.1 hypothetical protein NL50_06470 [Clostridium acetobutylicum]
MDPKVIDIIKIIIGILGVAASIVFLYFSIIHNYQSKEEETIEVPDINEDVKSYKEVDGLDTVILNNPDDTFVIDKREKDDSTVCL